MVSFEPLGNASTRSFQSLLTLDLNGVNVLVDVGCDELLSDRDSTKLVDAIPKIDLVLLTHATVAHVGAFCYLRNKHPAFRNIPTYATLPVVRMGQMMTIDLYQSVGLCGPFDDLDAMDEAVVEELWSEVNVVKYSQPLPLHGHPRLEGVVITAYNAGHSLGGTLWKVFDGVDSIIVALDWNHTRDAHLSGAFLEPKTGTVVRDLQKPSLLVTSTEVSTGETLTTCRQQLLDSVDQALKMGGTVFIPTSSGSRVLELILVLDQFVAANHKGVPLIYCSHMGKQALVQASAMLEWMVPSIISDWQIQNESPFATRHVRHASSLKQLQQKWPSGPRIVFATGECLESGMSKEIFLEAVAEDPQSAILLTELCPHGTLGAYLHTLAKGPQLTQLTTQLKQVPLDLGEPLEGPALASFMERKQAELDKVEAAAALERRNQELIDTSAAAQEESSDSEDEMADGNGDNIGTGVFLYGTDTLDYKYTGEGAESFPFNPKRRKADDYGDFLPPDMFKTKKSSQSDRKSEPTAAENNKDDAAYSQLAETAVEIKSATAALSSKPTKIVKVLKDVKALCWIAHIDMNGITNARSLQMIVKQVQPVRVIGIPGALPPSQGVIDQLRSGRFIFAEGSGPVTFERTNFSIDVRVDPSVPLQWHQLWGGYSIARVSGNLEMDSQDKNKKLSALLVSSAQVATEHRPVTIGDLRLIELRKVLTESGYRAEFKSQGVLACNDKVFVRKTGDGKYLIEGSIDREFYAVREAVRKFITTV